MLARAAAGQDEEPDIEHLQAAWDEKMAQMASETPPDLGKAVAGINNQQMAKQVKERIQKARVKWLQGHWEAWRMKKKKKNSCCSNAYQGTAVVPVGVQSIHIRGSAAHAFEHA